MSKLIERLLDEGKGILRLAPVWVPRANSIPGRRIKLHPDDYYATGQARGGIVERWLSSGTHAINGPGTPPDEGLSYITGADGREKMLFRDAVDALKGQIIGDALFAKHGRWPALTKFFDNNRPIPLHIHCGEKHAALIGQHMKPEMYFFPAQLNLCEGEFPYTFFGLNPGTTKEQVLDCLKNFTKGDNKLFALSRAYKLYPDTGWDVPPGVLHGPGSLCTYEPQFASDVFSAYQSVHLSGDCTPLEYLCRDTPQDRVGDFNYLLEVIDWELNIDPMFYENRFMAPKPVRPAAEMTAEGYLEEWICYKSAYTCAKRLTVMPGKTVTVKDAAAYGMIMLQGHGTFGGAAIETPALIRYGQLTYDEYFVTETAAKKGVVIKNHSQADPIVMLKHFAENLELKI